MPKITEMYAFVACEDETPDDEGIIGLMGPNGPMPAVGADMDRVEWLRTIITQQMGDRPWKIVTFKQIETLEEHEHANRCCRICGTHTTPHKGCVLR